MGYFEKLSLAERRAYIEARKKDLEAANIVCRFLQTQLDSQKGIHHGIAREIQDLETVHRELNAKEFDGE